MREETVPETAPERAEKYDDGELPADLACRSTPGWPSLDPHLRSIRAKLCSFTNRAEIVSGPELYD